MRPFDAGEPGLATRPFRGTLIDLLRDRIMLPMHDPGGMPADAAGFLLKDAGPARAIARGRTDQEIAEGRGGWPGPFGPI